GRGQVDVLDLPSEEVALRHPRGILGTRSKTMAAPRGLRNQDCLQALPNPERPAPSERVPAILTAAPSIVLERDAGGAAHPARARGWFLNPAPTTLVGDLRLEPLSRLLRVSLGLKELLRLLRVCADVPGEGDVIGDESDRFLDLANSSKPRVLRTLAGLDEALPRRRKLIPVQGVAPSLPGVLGHGNRCAEVRGLTNRVPGEGEQLPHPVRFARMGHLRGSDQVLEERIVHGLALEEDVA